MLVVIGKNLINPQQIVTIQDQIVPKGSKSPKRIVISLSNGDYFTYDAGGEGYAAACKLRDKMLKGAYMP